MKNTELPIRDLIWVWGHDESGFSGRQSTETFRGPRGFAGDNGKSSYAIWLDAGNEGDLDDYFAAIKGDKGNAGDSAYKVWLDVGNVGDENAFLLDIKGTKGDKGDKGDDGTSVKILGTVETVGDLPSSGNDVGDGYMVGEEGYLYIWTGELPWVNVGQIRGPAGPTGPANTDASTFTTGTIPEARLPARLSQVNLDARHLVKANNLSDVANAATARTNLGLSAVASSGSASDLSSGTVPNVRFPNRLREEYQVISDVDSFTTSGWGRLSGAAVPSTFDAGTYAINYIGNVSDGIQLAYRIGTNGAGYYRCMVANAWQEWQILSFSSVPSTFLKSASNLSDVANAATARTNLGLSAVASSGSASDLSAGTIADARLPTRLTQANLDARHPLRANNLSDVANVATARNNLGLSTVAATGSASDLASGTVQDARLPTRLNSANNNADALLNSYGVYINTATDFDTILTQRGLYQADANSNAPANGGLWWVEPQSIYSSNQTRQIATRYNTAPAQMFVRITLTAGGWTPWVPISPSLAAIATSGSASDLTTGTIAEARLPTRLSQTSLDARHLNVASNLSDVANAATARSNLGLGSAALRDDSYFQTALGYTPLNAAGGTISGGLSVSGGITANGAQLRINGAGNRHIWIGDDSGNNNGLIFQTAADNTLRFRSYDLGSATTYKEMTLSPSGNVTIPGDIVFSAGNLTTLLNGKAATTHTHTIAQVTNLQSTLDGKASTASVNAKADTSALNDMVKRVALGAEEYEAVGVNANKNLTENYVCTGFVQASTGAVTLLNRIYKKKINMHIPALGWVAIEAWT